MDRVWLDVRVAEWRAGLLTFLLVGALAVVVLSAPGAVAATTGAYNCDAAAEAIEPVRGGHGPIDWRADTLAQPAGDPIHSFDDQLHLARVVERDVRCRFAPKTTTSGRDDCDHRVFRHYTTEQGRVGIQADGFIRAGASGRIYVTPTVYDSRAVAQAQLALPTTPSGYFEIPRDRLADLYGPNVVRPNYGHPGGGIEYWTSVPIAAAGLRWVVIGP